MKTKKTSYNKKGLILVGNLLILIIMIIITIIIMDSLSEAMYESSEYNITSDIQSISNISEIGINMFLIVGILVFLGLAIGVLVVSFLKSGEVNEDYDEDYDENKDEEYYQQNKSDKIIESPEPKNINKSLGSPQKRKHL